MGSVKVDKFGGMLPAWDDRFLPEDQASLTRDTYLYSGACVGWRKPKVLRSLTNPAAKYAYRVPTVTQAIAGANLVFTGNPTAGGTVTIGEMVYTFVATPTNPFDIQVGSSTQNTAATLFYALSYGSYDETIIGKNTPPNPAVTPAISVIGNATRFTSGTSTPGANTVALVKIIPAETMQLTDINVLPETTAAGAKFKGVVYNNVNRINATGTKNIDIPSSLVGTGAEVVGSTAGTVLTSHLAVPITLLAGSTYWIGFLMDTNVAFALGSTGTKAVSQSVTYTSGPPNPFQTTNISGVTTSGTSVGNILSSYNQDQPNWMIYGSLSVLSSTDALSTLSVQPINASGSFLTMALQAPSFGDAYNLTPVSNTDAALIWLKDLNSFADTTVFFTGGKNQTLDKTITGASSWLEFVDQDTNVIRTPVVDDSFERYYFASPTQPPQYNTADRIKNGQSPFILGVPPPPITPTLSVTAGGNPSQIGFPGSISSNVYTVGTSQTLILYPVQTSIAVALDSINIKVSAIFDPSIFNMTGYLFANTAATTAVPDPPNTPGDLIASAQPTTLAGPVSLATTVSSVFVNSPQLNPGTQYWIGVVISGSNNVKLMLGDDKLQGFSAVGTFITDPVTGLPAAPPMNPNFVDLELWGELSPGNVGSAQLETRAYVYTWVTAYGEEGPPSAAAILDAYDNATWIVGLQPPLAEDMGVLRNIVKTNIYRTMSSQAGGAVFFFVGSVSPTATTFVDQVTDDVVALNATLPSTNWFGPPTNLQGIIAMPNGITAGFVGNEVWFSEPFRPHAWPAGNVLTTDYPIVGLGVTGVTLVAATSTVPHTFTGVQPSQMSAQKIPLPEPCISRGSVLSTENGVYYASANGLVKVTGSSIGANVTQAWITRERWNAFTPQKFIRAVKNVSAYFAFGTTGVTNGTADISVARQGYTLELSEVADKESFTLYPQVGGHRLGLSPLSSPTGLDLDNVLSDPWSGVALLISGGSIYYYDFGDQAPQIVPALWRSKKFQASHRDNFAGFRVWFDKPPGGPQSPPRVRTTVPFQENPPTTPRMTFVPGMLGIVRIIADGTYITERELRFSTELMQVSSAQKYSTWQIEFEGVVSVTNIKMATSVKELGGMK